MKKNFTEPLLCLFVLLWLLPANVSAQRVARFDTTRIQVRRFDKTALENFRQDPDFAYGEERTFDQRNLWREFWRWVFEHIFAPLSDPDTSRFWSYLIIGICTLVVIYAILRLTGSEWLGVFSGRSKKIKPTGFSEVAENIHELDFEKLIAEAIAGRNYTRATRLFYLKTLKTLSDKQLIDWQMNKTNHQYLQEVARLPFEPEFRHLTRLFEYICYGDFPLEEPDFREVEIRFRDFERKV
jgi:Domain of unknown function (DUF4129)